LESRIAISELTAGLVSLIDGILAATGHAPAASGGRKNINIVDALQVVRDRFEKMRVECNEGKCSADDFVTGMNGIMQELRSRTS
jgi:hypothetical protein